VGEAREANRVHRPHRFASLPLSRAEKYHWLPWAPRETTECALAASCGVLRPPRVCVCRKRGIGAAQTKRRGTSPMICRRFGERSMREASRHGNRIQHSPQISTMQSSHTHTAITQHRHLQHHHLPPFHSSPVHHISSPQATLDFGPAAPQSSAQTSHPYHLPCMRANLLPLFEKASRPRL